MSKRISINDIKSHIKYLEKELQEKSAEIEEYNKENEEYSKENKYGLLYDLTEEYLREENLKGQIQASKYILNNCWRWNK